MRGGDDGRLSFARVPCPLLPFFLVILLPLLPLPPAAQLQVVGLGMQVLLVGGSRLVVASTGKAAPLSGVSRGWLPLFGLGLVLVLGLVQERCYYLPAQSTST